MMSSFNTVSSHAVVIAYLGIGILPIYKGTKVQITPDSVAELLCSKAVDWEIH